MPTLLALEVSPRGDRSISRALGNRFVEHWQARNPGGTVIFRDLNASRIPYMDDDWIAGVYAPPDVERTPRDAEGACALGRVDRRTASRRCAPRQHADVQLHHSCRSEVVDRLCGAARLHPPSGPRLAGMRANKRAKLIVVSRDNYDLGGPREADDLVTPVLRKALGFMGINDVGVVRAGVSFTVNLGKVRIEDHLESMRLRLRRWQQADLSVSRHQSRCSGDAALINRRCSSWRFFWAD